MFRGLPLHVWRSRVGEGSTGGAAGRVVSARPLRIATGDGWLELLEVQLEGRKRIPAADFVNGQRVVENESLGETEP
jgi:methionyl-tRNA formyltransferase